MKKIIVLVLFIATNWLSAQSLTEEWRVETNDVSGSRTVSMPDGGFTVLANEYKDSKIYCSLNFYNSKGELTKTKPNILISDNLISTDLIYTNDGNFLASEKKKSTGESSIVKFTPEGTILWKSTLTPSQPGSYYEIYSVCQKTDGGYLFSARLEYDSSYYLYNKPEGYSVYYSLSEDGKQRTELFTNQYNLPYKIIETKEGFIGIAGMGSLGIGEFSLNNYQGEKIWKVETGCRTCFNSIFDVKVFSDGSFLLLVDYYNGASFSYNDVKILIVSPEGKITLNKVVDVDSLSNFPSSIFINPDETITLFTQAVGDSENSRITYVSMDRTGKELWRYDKNLYGLIISNYNYSYGSFRMTNGSFLLRADSYDYSKRFYIKLTPDSILSVPETETINSISYSNPIQNTLSIESVELIEKYNIYNTQGINILEGLNKNNNKLEIDFTSFASGMYYAVIQTQSGKTETIKLVKN